MKKGHSYGEGTIYQTADGRWIAKIRLGHAPDGKPLIKRFSARTKAEAEKKLRDFKKAQYKGTEKSFTPYSVTAYFDFWLKTYQFPKLKPLSFDRLESSVRNHILPFLGQKKFDQVSLDDVQ